jgi:integrase/recombinase XerD
MATVFSLLTSGKGGRAMQVSKAIEIWLDYHKSNSRENTRKAYQVVLSNFSREFGERDVREITSDEVLAFLNRVTEGTKQQTKRTRYSHLSAFFNFMKNNIDQNLQNPCDTPIMKKLFRNTGLARWNTIEKDTIDEVIFKTVKTRNRLMLELMARGGMRIGEVLKLTPNDIHERKLTIRDPKSGKEQEFAFIPQKVAERLKEYIRENRIDPDQRIFRICYETARSIVRKAGSQVGVELRPHDLRRHAATHASRSGVPVEIVSKVILRHANLSTTQRYLGKVSDTEAMRWIDNLYG